MRFGKWIVHNGGLKVIALVLAVITWFYVFNEIEHLHTKESSPAQLLPSYGKLISRKLYVKAIVIGEVSEGYRMNVNDVQIDPPYFVVAGPASVLRTVERLETEPIDISRYTKTTMVDAHILPITPSIDVGKLTVKVTIPIKKAESGGDTE